MSRSEIEKRLQKLKELETMADELSAEIEAHKDAIKQEMSKRGVEELKAGKFTARFTKVTSGRFNTAAFKEEHAELYAAYTTLTAYRRFSVV